MTAHDYTEQDLMDYQEQLDNHGPTCPECGEGAMNPKNPADANCDEFYCGECLFNDSDDEGLIMTFEEYEAEYLSHLGPQARNLLRMGWNARGEYGSSPVKPDSSGNPQGFLDGSDHIPDATKMVQGDVQCMGNLYFNDEDNYENALVITFADRAGLKAALDSKQCRFTVFGGEV